MFDLLLLIAIGYGLYCLINKCRKQDNSRGAVTSKDNKKREAKEFLDLVYPGVLVAFEELGEALKAFNGAPPQWELTSEADAATRRLRVQMRTIVSEHDAAGLARAATSAKWSYTGSHRSCVVYKDFYLKIEPRDDMYGQILLNLAKIHPEWEIIAEKILIFSPK